MCYIVNILVLLSMKKFQNLCQRYKNNNDKEELGSEVGPFKYVLQKIIKNLSNNSIYYQFSKHFVK